MASTVRAYDNAYDDADDSTESTSSASLNALGDTLPEDVESIALLREIFPDENTERLRELHNARVRRHRSALASPLSLENNNNGLPRRLPDSRRVILPHDFLRLPPTIAVRRHDPKARRWRYVLLSDMSRHVADSIFSGGSSEMQRTLYYSRAVFRDDQIGLGLTLCEDRGYVRVLSLSSRDGKRWASPLLSPPDLPFHGPAFKEGVVPGDILVGINGIALSEICPPNEKPLKLAVFTIQNSPDPVVLHLLRGSQVPNSAFEMSPPPISSLSFPAATPSLLDETDQLEESQSIEHSFPVESSLHSTPSLTNGPQFEIHPFVETLFSNKIIKSINTKLSASRQLFQFMTRAQQWESTQSISTVDESSGADLFVSLVGVRKALSVRIMNSFTDGNRMAYTIWVYDLESGEEWYAPVRYYDDFRDLRHATVNLLPVISKLAFPKSSGLFSTAFRSESNQEAEEKTLLLESFLRSLCGIIYRAKIDVNMSEVAIHLQSFLGCGSISKDTRQMLSLVELDIQEQQRLSFKRSIQYYTYRLFLLDEVAAAVDLFVSMMRGRKPTLNDIEALEAEGRTILQARAMQDLGQIRAFLDHFQDLVLDGCMEDFQSIVASGKFDVLNQQKADKNIARNMEKIIREAVRTQVEIEIYLPLRSVVSRWLVNGWRHEDMEIQFKIKELKRRPPSFFRIPPASVGVDDWDSVTRTLREGVGQSTLPCDKLQAIVDASRAISNLFARQNDGGRSCNKLDVPPLGADDFLPIFIYCVVQAEVDRPCALCILLRSFCDGVNRIGEIGYYLACFEAAIAHFHELDLSEKMDQMESFVSVPLNDT